MFDKNSLGDLAETIVYVNLLLAFLALIALYDQRRVRAEDDITNGQWSQNVENQLAHLTARVQAIETQLSLILQKIEGSAGDILATDKI